MEAGEPDSPLGAPQGSSGRHTTDPKAESRGRFVQADAHYTVFHTDGYPRCATALGGSANATKEG